MQSQTQNSLLQEGRGIDHLVVLVRDLQSSTKEYRDLLGFDISVAGRHPGGTENSVAGFQDETYLELLSVYDPAKAADTVAFLEKHEGAGSVGLNIGSADATINFLRSRGIETGTGSGTIKLENIDETPSVLWKWVDLKAKTSISDSIFFIEYTQERATFRKRHPEKYIVGPHPNGARRLASIWTIAKDLREGARPYETIGLHVNRQVSLDQVSAKGVEFQVGHGTILLLAPSKADGATAKLLQQRTEGSIIGSSVEVGSLSSAKQLLDKNGVEHQDYWGIYGKSLLVSPERTHGLWLEMYQD